MKELSKKDMERKDACSSCRQKFIHHNGLILTCKELQKAKKKIKALQAKYKKDQEELYRRREVMNAI